MKELLLTVRISLWKAKMLLFVLMIIAAFFAGARINHFSSSHASAAIDESRITYISVPIVAKDTLSGIACEYYSDEFGSLDAYINRIKEYNSLTSDVIYAGNHLIIPVYGRTDTEN